MCQGVGVRIMPNGPALDSDFLCSGVRTYPSARRRGHTHPPTGVFFRTGRGVFTAAAPKYHVQPAAAAGRAPADAAGPEGVKVATKMVPYAPLIPLSIRLWDNR
jgi:hypothetical protein